MRKNRIQFPTHRPDVQDAQCCAQVGRSSLLLSFPTPGFPGQDWVFLQCTTCSVQGGIFARARGKGASFSGAGHVGKQVILPS